MKLLSFYFRGQNWLPIINIWKESPTLKEKLRKTKKYQEKSSPGESHMFCGKTGNKKYPLNGKFSWLFEIIEKNKFFVA